MESFGDTASLSGCKKEATDLTVLHATVKKETERLLRWKAEMDMTADEEDEKIRVIQEIKESQARELEQLEKENEELQAELEESRGKQEDFVQKVDRARREAQFLAHKKDHLLVKLKKSNEVTEDLKKKLAVSDENVDRLINRLHNLESEYHVKNNEMNSTLKNVEEKHDALKEDNRIALNELTIQLENSAAISNMKKEKVEQLNQQLASLSGNLEEKQAILSERRKKKEALVQENSVLRETLSREYQEKQTELQKTRESLDLAKQRYADVKNAVAEKASENKLLSDRIDSLVEEKHRMVQETEETASMNRRLLLKNKLMRDDLEEIKKENSIMEEKMQELNRLTEENKVGQQTLEELEKRGAVLKEEMSTLNRVRRENVSTREKVSQLEFKAKKIGITDEDVTDLNAALSRKKLEIEQAKKDGEQELKKWTSELETEKNKIVSVETDIPSLDLRIQQLTSSKQELEAQLNSMNEAVQAEQVKSDSLREREAELCRSKDQKLAELQEKIDSMNTSMSEQATRLNISIAQEADRLTEQQQLEEQLGNVTKQLGTLKQKLVQREAEIEEQMKVKLAAEEKFKEVNKNCEDLENQRKEKQKVLAETDKEIEALSAELNSIELSKQASKEKETEICQLEEKVIQNQQNLESVEKNISESKARIEDGNKKVAEKEEELQELRSKAVEQAASLELARLQTQLQFKERKTQLEKQLEEMRKQLITSEEKLANRIQEKKIKEENKVKLQQQNDEMKDEIVKLRDELTRVEKERSEESKIEKEKEDDRDGDDDLDDDLDRIFRRVTFTPRRTPKSNRSVLATPQNQRRGVMTSRSLPDSIFKVPDTKGRPAASPVSRSAGASKSFSISPVSRSASASKSFTDWLGKKEENNRMETGVSERQSEPSKETVKRGTRLSTGAIRDVNYEKSFYELTDSEEDDLDEEEHATHPKSVSLTEKSPAVKPTAKSPANSYRKSPAKSPAKSTRKSLEKSSGNSPTKLASDSADSKSLKSPGGKKVRFESSTTPSKPTVYSQSPVRKSIFKKTPSTSFGKYCLKRTGESSKERFHSQSAADSYSQQKTGKDIYDDFGFSTEDESD